MKRFDRIAGFALDRRLIRTAGKAMKFATFATAVLLAVFSTTASAATFNVVATDVADATRTSTFDFGGSAVSVDFTFDVTGASIGGSFSNVTGTAIWNDGTSRSFAPTSAVIFWARVNPDSYVLEILFRGNPVSLPGATALRGIILSFRVVENGYAALLIPFSDLLARASVSAIGTDYTFPAGSSTGGQLSETVTSFAITAVPPSPIPLPASLPMLVLALGGIGALGWHRRRAG